MLQWLGSKHGVEVGKILWLAAIAAPSVAVLLVGLKPAIAVNGVCLSQVLQASSLQLLGAQPVGMKSLGAQPVGVKSVGVKLMPAKSASVKAAKPVSTKPVAAQVPTSTRPKILAAGDGVLVNGRAIPGAWVQWSDPSASDASQPGAARIGLSDFAVQQGLGGEFLDTEVSTVQPVQWFSEPKTSPLNLPTRHDRGMRYLDVTAWAKAVGWKLQITGSRLTLQTPPTTITGLRQGKQAWGDRLVIDLDRPMPWTLDQNSTELLLTLDGKVSGNLAQTFKLIPSTYLKSIKFETKNDQTLVRIGLTGLRVRSQVTMLPQPHRLVVDLRPDAFTPQNILWAPGVRWRRQLVNVNSPQGLAQFPVVFLEIDPATLGLTLRPMLANPRALVGTAPLSQMASQAGAIAAINAGFFNRNNQLSLGAIRQEGRWLSGPILGRGAIAWNAKGEFKLARLVLQETLLRANQPPLKLTHFNSAYVQAGIARYSPDWGSSYTTLTNNEVVYSLDLNAEGEGVITAQQSYPLKGGAIAIPKGGLLVARGNGNPSFSLGDRLTLQQQLTPAEFGRYPNILAAGPLLVQNRQIVLDAAAEKFSPAFMTETASRSGIAQTAEGKVLLVAVHDRLGGGGASLADMAVILQQLGAVDGLNFDGGSSTALYLGGQLLDRLPRTAARVHNGFGVFATP